MFSAPSPPKAPKPAKLQAPPEKTDDQVQALADEQRRKYSGGTSGMALTRLSGAGTTSGRSLAVASLGGSGGY